MKIADHFIGKLKAGQPDVEGWQQSSLARVEHDGSTHFYALPHATTLHQFKVAAEVAWEQDADHAELSPSEGFSACVVFS